MKKLTEDQIEYFKKKMVPKGVPIRFLQNGQNLDVITGELMPKGINIMHQIVYWNFDKETGKEIANLLGVNAYFG